MMDEVQTIPAGNKVSRDKKIVDCYAVVTHGRSCALTKFPNGFSV
jgi:hypothetical protein